MVRLVEDMKFSDQERAEMLAYHREHLCAFCTLNEDIVKGIRDLVEVMKDEPEELISLSKVYHMLRRQLGDE